MQTTTFRCGHCNNLMAVSSEYLGKQVQCPTCRQVVVAPAGPTPAAAPTPVQTQMPLPEPQPTPAPYLGPDLPLESLSPPSPLPSPPAPVQPSSGPAASPFPSLSLDSEHESIFSNDDNRDDLFDEPTPVLAPLPTPEYYPEPTPAVLIPPLPSEMPPTVEEEPGYPEAASLEPVSQQVNWGTQQPVAAVLPNESSTESELASGGRESRRKKGPELNWPLLLMIPLVSYAILSTALVFYLWNRMEVIRNSVANPIEYMPDVHGDAPGATKKNVRRNWLPDDSQFLASLPEDHVARLGQKIKVGNLEVEPLRVERGKVDIKVAGYEKVEPTIADCLILRLRFRNLSDEYTFAPLDNAFDRKWKGIKVDKYPPLNYKPFTVLQVGSTNFFGGTAKWTPRPVPAALKRELVMWMEGPGRGEKPTLVDPGQSLDSFVATDGDNENLVSTALAYKGDLVWRVHVRQGPVEVKGRSDPIPSTTVVAVSFKPSEVVRN